jgi:hypothetical protein
LDSTSNFELQLCADNPGKVKCRFLCF